MHPLCSGSQFGGFWGALVTPHCYRFGQDETTAEELCTLMRERRLALNAIRADTPFAPQPNWGPSAREAIEAAEVVFVSGEGEAELVRQTGNPRELTWASPPVARAADVEPAAIGCKVGPSLPAGSTPARPIQ